ncbi:MAG: redoxin domain-containing protein [Rubrobacteraceae bacterium]
MARTKVASIPEVGDKAPEFNLPSAQGGQLRLSMRTARGPVVVVFYRGTWAEEDVEYFKALAEKEDEINMAAASVVGIGVSGPEEARDFVRQSGIKSYVLYDYAKVASGEWGTLQKDKEHGEYARPAVFIVGADHDVVHAWTDERPDAEELLAKISEITGLPKPVEEGDEEEKPKKPKRAAKTDEPTEDKAEKSKGEEKPEGGEPQKEPEKPEAQDEKPTAEAEKEPVAEKVPEESVEGQETPKAQTDTDEVASEPVESGSEGSSEQGESEARTEDEKKAGE